MTNNNGDSNDMGLKCGPSYAELEAERDKLKRLRLLHDCDDTDAAMAIQQREEARDQPRALLAERDHLRRALDWIERECVGWRPARAELRGCSLVQQALAATAEPEEEIDVKPEYITSTADDIELADLKAMIRCNSAQGMIDVWIDIIHSPFAIRTRENGSYLVTNLPDLQSVRVWLNGFFVGYARRATEPEEDRHE